MADSLENIVRMVISQFGTDILKEERFVNILMDYGVLKDCPETRDAFRLMIRKGYSNQILALGMSGGAWARFKSAINGKNYVSKPVSNDWLKKEKEIVKKFVVECGFSNETAEYAFDLILFGVGWIDNVRKRPISPVVISNKNIVQSKKQSSPKSSVNLSNTTVKPHSTAPVSYSSITDTQFLIVKVSPSNACVYVDGVQQSVNNGMTAVELPVGKHNYEVSCVSYKSKTGNVALRSDTKAIVDVALELDCKTANVVIKTVEPQTEIYIDGVKYGVNEWKGQLPFGTYDVEFRLEKHYSEKRKLRILSNNPMIINNMPMKPICGNLKIDVTPYGSKIYLDGNEMGETPIIIKDVQAGYSHIKIVSPEGTTIEENITVLPNEVIVFTKDIPTLFFTDYNNVQIGDYFYEDGSFSHELAEGKTAIGIVFSLKTSLSDKQRGWSHGLVLALEKKTKFSFSLNETTWGSPKVGIPDSIRKNEDDIMQLIKQNNELTSGFDIISNPIIQKGKLFPAFEYVRNYPVPSPSNTSGWYIPTVEQLVELLYNTNSLRDINVICKRRNSDDFYSRVVSIYSKRSELYGNIVNGHFVSATEYDDERFWQLFVSWSTIEFSNPKKSQKLRVLPVLSF